MKNNLALYRNGSIVEYAASIAASWTYPNDVFVAASFGYLFGLSGLVAQAGCDAIALIIFGIISSRLIIINKNQAYTMIDSVANFSNSIKFILSSFSILFLVYSATVQITGFHQIVTYCNADTPKFISLIIAALAAFCCVWKYGLQGSVVTDKWKYFIILSCAIFMMVHMCVTSGANFTQIPWSTGDNSSKILDILAVTIIGAICTPYIDQAMWQRALSLPKDKIVKAFTLASVMYAIVPIIFTIIGALARTYTNDPNWTLSSLFSGTLGVVFAIMLLCVVISTLDSNLCAIYGIYVSISQSIAKGLKNFDGRIAMALLIATAGLIFCLTDASLVILRVVSSPVRSLIIVPVILYIFDRYNPCRLFWAMLFGTAFSFGGFYWAFCAENGLGWVFTTIAIFIPLIGYSPKKEKSNV